MITRSDVVVVGAGPAGAVAALTLARRSVDVVLVDRSVCRPFRIGEGLPPEARPILNSLGLLEQFEAAGHLPSHGNRSLWGGPKLQTTDFFFNPYGHGWHLDRQAFDCMLAQAAEAAGAKLLLDTRVESIDIDENAGLCILSLDLAGCNGSA